MNQNSSSKSSLSPEICWVNTGDLYGSGACTLQPPLTECFYSFFCNNS
jgi:hypothetical protein